jgi:hypothetical protein
VQRLGPPLVAGHPEPRHPGRVVHQQRVSLDTRSRARARSGSDCRQNGSDAAGPPGAHANAEDGDAVGAAVAATRRRSRRRGRLRMAAGCRVLWLWRSRWGGECGYIYY